MRALALLLVVCFALPAAAETLLPERRLDVSRDVDFYGADLQPMYDVPVETCRRLCLDNPECGAFTYNTRNVACFPKRAVSERVPYDGALSAEVLETAAEAQARAAARAGAAGFLDPADLDAARRQAQALGLRHPGDGAALSARYRAEIGRAHV